MPWYVFNGGSPNDPSFPDQYALTASNGQSPPTCLGSQNMCALQAVDDSGHPNITENLKNEIIRALENNTNSTNVLLKS